MRNKTVEVTPFKYTYYVVSRFNRKRIELKGGELEKILAYVGKENITAETEIHPPEIARSGIQWFAVEYMKAKYGPEYTLYNHLGAVIDPKDVYNVEVPPRRRWYYRYERNWSEWDEKKKRLVRRKNNVNRIKESYGTYHDPDQYGESYTTIINNYHRYPKTFNEIRKNVADEADGKWTARGSRKYRQLPNSWDDRPIAAWKYRESWKHNSKRSKQWKVI